MGVHLLTRRSAVTGAVVAGVALVAGFVTARSSSAAQAKPGAAAANGYGPASSGTGARLAALADVPQGGGLVVTDADVVLVRPQGDTVDGFSATCTHQGCTVDGVRDGKISCPCHGSVFDATTGAVVAGPASRPLPKVAVVVRGADVYRA
jgi:Rieske Fe-S protein